MTAPESTYSASTERAKAIAREYVRKNCMHENSEDIENQIPTFLEAAAAIQRGDGQTDKGGTFAEVLALATSARDGATYSREKRYWQGYIDGMNRAPFEDTPPAAIQRGDEPLKQYKVGPFGSTACPAFAFTPAAAKPDETSGATPAHTAYFKEESEFWRATCERHELELQAKGMEIAALKKQLAEREAELAEAQAGRAHWLRELDRCEAEKKSLQEVFDAYVKSTNETTAKSYDEVKRACDKNEQLHAKLAEQSAALAYWIPEREPLYAQHDEVSIAHRRKWHDAKSLLAQIEALAGGTPSSGGKQTKE